MKPNPRTIVPAVLLVIALVLVARFLWTRGPHNGLDASGTVEATEAQLGFPAPGKVDSVCAHEGDRVKPGQVLALQDSREIRARAEQAAAQEAVARAMLQELERGSRPEEVAQAQAARDAAARRLDDARQDLERARALLGHSDVSQQTFDKARVARDVAEKQLQQADEQLRLVRIGPRQERIDAQRAAVEQAAAAARAARVALDNTTIRAPFEGVVTVRHREPGEVVAAGSPIVSVLNLADRWVRIYVREDRVAAVHLGDAADVRCDTYPRRRYPGRVEFIASEAEFTPRSVQTAEERVKLVYAVKVSVAGDSTFDLKPGMPADVRLHLQNP